ncbi:enoyl-CoA hydratase/isomerase family protein [Alcaligenes endophyticus]|uniref:3-hydroxyisobutyryl-CoA hydrolase n=1 Tax=Alcaligenes endophyticus TaxID=1929088 RepID=A0ABT8EJU5_9BURK|nr:enoyl-CoA hydratase/isomerase family protein [Alcaligenes endophyticus]MCX5591723.1 enoyl-CoA hydratase/isomerase family protein [Alcaligenes endophyticus]MDN4121400.1 enoyl-CoA hydratase/isomerase family protein [Alcaligenes endophyticus]
MSESVVFEVRPTAGGLNLGVARLNRPDSLNSLNLEMCSALYQQLLQWQDDDSIAMVLLEASGERAFCAGGDLHGLYAGMQANTSGQAWDNHYAREFFDVEYRLDYLLHRYAKPVLGWGSGIVMGGGVGLFMACSHRVCSDTTRWAMPEISIGLFPDVGGTWMLSHLPAGMGYFLALTGAQLGASDCLHLGLANYYVEQQQYAQLQAALLQQNWTACAQDNAALLDALLAQFTPQSLPTGPLQQHYQAISAAFAGLNFDRMCAQITAWAQSDDAWLARAAKTFQAGAPGSARLSYSLLRQARYLSLAEVFRLEYIVSLQCGVQGDFQEGIRALLIDKDKQPKWQPATLSDATDEWVKRFFVAAWPADTEHPLADIDA